MAILRLLMMALIKINQTKGMMKVCDSNNPEKPSYRGLFLILFSLLTCLLPIVIFQIGYKSHFVSKEIVLLIIFDFLLAGLAFEKNWELKLEMPQILILCAALIVFSSNSSEFHLLAVLGMYLIMFLLITNAVAIGIVFILLAWSAVIATIFSFYQHWSSAYNVLPSWLMIENYSSRMGGFFGQPNLLACLIVIGLFAWLQSVWQRFDIEDWHWFYFVPVVIFVWALLLTGSRAGVLSFVSALLLLGWALVRVGELKFLKFFATHFSWSLSLGILLFLFIQPPGIEINSGRVINFASQSSGTGERLIFGASALAMGFDHILTGVGLGGYRRLLGHYMVPVAEWLHIPYESIRATLWAHNDFLHIFAECGIIVFLIFLIVFMRILIRLRPTNNPNAMFCFCGMWSFFVFMQFGHPFNNHVLVFFLILMLAGALQLSPGGYVLKVSKKITIYLLIPCLVFVNFYILSHAYDMYYLKRYLRNVVMSQPLTVERIISLRTEHNYHAIVRDPLVGWEFQFKHLQALGNYTVRHVDSELAAYLIPEFKEFQEEHAAFALTYELSRLYFMTGNYSACKDAADQAYALKPDRYDYSNFGHICLVFDMSRRKKIPVSKLLGESYFTKLMKNKVFSMDVLDDNLCAL